MKHRADIDGLRSLAVLPVVFFHAGLVVVSGGFVGVDVFFVISGFLITSILKNDMDNNRYSLLEFYERRIRRILPALTIVIVATWVFCWFLFLPSYFVDFSKSVISTAGFISNLYFWKYSGYFDSTAQLRPLLHTWSLGVEEQFYIFMPIAMFLVHKYLNKLWVPIFSIAAIASLALSIYCTKVAPTANFFILPTRAWELLMGALLTLSQVRTSTRSWPNSLLGLAGLALILVPVFAYSEATPFPGLMAMPPCLGAALLLYTGQDPKALMSRALSWVPLVWIGQISYSLYLIHWPVAVFVRYITLSNPTLLNAVFIIVVSTLLAALSWWLVERPFRNRQFIKSRPILLIGAICVLGFMASMGVAGVAANGFPSRFPNFKPAETTENQEGSWKSGQCFFSDFAYENWKPEACDLTHNGTENVLLWGDSFAAHYAPGLIKLAPDIPYHVYEYAAAGCPPVLSYYSYARVKCTAFNQNVLKIIDTLHTKKVILSARWVDLQHHGLDELGATLRTLRAHGVEVYVIGQSPVFVTEVNLIAFRESDGKQAVDRWPDSIHGELNAQVEAQISDMHDSHVHFINPEKALCDNGVCPYRRNNAFLFVDNGHLSPVGSVNAVERYFPFYVKPTPAANPDQK